MEGNETAAGVAGAGGPVALSEEERRLSDALATAVAELGVAITFEERAGAGASATASTGNDEEASYGVYALVCRVARKVSLSLQ